MDALRSRPVADGVPRPLVLISTCHREVGDVAAHVSYRRYTDFVRLAGGIPLLVPGALPEELDLLLATVDGVLLTGSASNVHPSCYGESVLDPSLPQDRERDAWTLPLVPRAIAAGMPLFAICRGAQEVNVALGGSLHQAVHEVDGFFDHRSEFARTPQERYAPRHTVTLERDGSLQRWLGCDEITVNSVHGQGVQALADGLRVEARAPDGLIEAFSFAGGTAFNLAVQWHPEWRCEQDPVSRRLALAFAEALSEHWFRRNRSMALI
ncbi:gamma-glutamyl-gamma-aminobutyrate hydrolase family protein [Paludibacterium yongneupense]|uniref:gamma-glutamyl-gamma-aminobutyrate hydrolase family protein n=1 Tax=Paludibacterium yongneupense TaxID=400061 RepID=UPI00041C61EA|nr:gamma-glutamyl-gamma-aminobutyrate hydrolase family protein [Paludibacterium yongneupense]